MNNRYMMAALEKPVESYRRLMAAIPESKWDLRSEANRFTPREVIAHLADCEAMLLGRLKDSVERPGTKVEFFDEDQRAIDLDYAGSNVQAQLELFASRRAETVAYVKQIRDWSGTIIHPEQGEMRTEDVLYTISGHDAYHIEHLTEYLRD